ncbi:MAG: FadR/GntR family transcriptional regulator [Roseivirga sp.]
MAIDLLNNFTEIVVEKPVDKIINQIKKLISSGQLKPGDKLPSERMLSERFGIGRTSVRDAIRKLEFYGILKTLPQSGTIVAGMGVAALEGLISDVLHLEGADFHSLVETRYILESNSAKFAALRRTDEDIAALESSLISYKDAVLNGGEAIEEDLMFHLKIAEAGKNSALKSMMLIIIPDILNYFKQHHVCGDGRSGKAVKEHELIITQIKDQDTQGVEEAMQAHLADVMNYTKKLRP